MVSERGLTTAEVNGKGKIELSGAKENQQKISWNTGIPIPDSYTGRRTEIALQVVRITT